MSCTKSKFSDKRMIQTKLNKLQKSGHWNRKDKTSRIYYCDECKAWHMTSMGSFDPTIKPVDVTVKFKERWDNLLNQ